MNRLQKQLLQGGVILFGIFILLLALSDVGELLRTLRGFTLWLLLPLSLLKLVNYAFRYSEWHYLLGVVGVPVKLNQPSSNNPPQLNLIDSLAIYLSGFPMAISPAKAGEVLKSAIVKHLTGVPIAQTAPVVLTERIVDGLAVLILIGLAGLIGGEAVFKEVEGVEASYIQGLILFTLITMLIGIGIIQIKPLMLRILAIWAKIPVLNRLQPWFAQFYLSSYEVLRLKNLIPTVGFGMVAYGTDCIALYLILRGLGVSHQNDLIPQTTFILGFTVIVAALSAMPAGAGARELSLSVLMVGLIGVNDGIAAAATVLNTFFQVGLGLLIGAAVILLFRERLFHFNDILIEDGISSSGSQQHE